MSIPPLVCSTPPPPDQCEDDKDPEDFDLQYNLSQDDDDESNNYDYGEFSTYNHFQSATTEIKKVEISSASEIIEKDQNKGIIGDNSENVEIVHGTNITNEDIVKVEEDIIEDLDLKVDDEPIVTNNKSNQNENETNKCNENSIKDENLDIPLNNVNQNETATFTLSALNVEVIDSESKDVILNEIETAEEDDMIEDQSNKIPVETNKLDIVLDNPVDSAEAIDNFSTDTNDFHQASSSVLENAKSDDDDFGDFDDFQFTTVDSKTSPVIDNCDNPWGNEQNDDSDFGGFKANFEETQSNNIVTDSQAKENEDDDFGDFDDFQSSAAESKINEIPPDPLTCHDVLDLQSPENESQIIERINKVLNSIFEQEIMQPEKEFDVKLESLLCETWGHLVDTDVRQPYMVNWNNSLGQKTLLKSLCIDSRNILFGPKWSYNMPKYAANLSSAPLQPQKQTTQSNVVQNEVTSAEKPASKPGTWSDPFTSDGQESCNTENENAAIETGPTDLDVFEAAMSKKPEKIYSNTINVQPIRQINLPDTHIFTPTDSETPLSKTIHYDSGPTVLLPQPVIENKSQPETLTPQPQTSMADNDEYWEFQDFKGSTNTNTSVPVDRQSTGETPNAAAKDDLPKSTVTYQTQLLQPIKLEPIMPTLNWPDPGEVKETFEDFSDFISNSSWSNEKQEQSASLPQVVPSENTKQLMPDSNLSAIGKSVNDLNTEVIPNDSAPSKVNDAFDDEFDTFKSALPPSKAPLEFDFSKVTSNTTENIPEQSRSPQINKTSTFDCIFPKIDTVKSDTISFVNTTKSSDVFTPNEDITREHVTRTSPLQSSGVQMTNNSLLQPTPASSNNQQKSGQILQPLSLESYSQINWPNPGIDLQDLSRFNPVETLHSLKSDLSVSGPSKGSSPVHNHKNSINNQVADDDIWGDFVSSKPKPQQSIPKKAPAVIDDDEWSDFVSSPTVKPQNGLNTISLNVHTNLNLQKSSNQNIFVLKNQVPLDIPPLNYITPKSGNHKSYNDKHFQNL